MVGRINCTSSSRRRRSCRFALHHLLTTTLLVIFQRACLRCNAFSRASFSLKNPRLTHQCLSVLSPSNGRNRHHDHCRISRWSTVSSLQTTTLRDWRFVRKRTHWGSSTTLVSMTSSATDDNSPTVLRYHYNTDIQRIFCLSDLHTDHSVNMQWLKDRMERMNTGVGSASSTTSSSVSLGATDLIIVAGDISHDLATFTKTLQLLRSTQSRVLFVPGNHEAWSSGSNDTTTVLEKLDQCLDICRSLDVWIDPVLIDHGRHPVWIVPLESWYDGTLTFDEELCLGFENWPWADFKRCNWGDQFPEMTAPNARIPQGLTEFFLERNRIRILQPWQDWITTHAQQERRDDGARDGNLSRQPPAVITVSHFAPNQQCLPDWKDLQSTTFQTEAWLDHGAGAMSAKFAKVAGTKLLDEQLRTAMPIGPTLHIFGHSHRPKDFLFQGIRYIHNPLGKPRERELHMINPNVDFQYVWNVQGDIDSDDRGDSSGQVEGPTVIRYWDDFGGGKELLWQRMAEINPGRYQHDGRRQASTPQKAPQRQEQQSQAQQQEQKR